MKLQSQWGQTEKRINGWALRHINTRSLRKENEPAKESEKERAVRLEINKTEWWPEILVMAIISQILLIVQIRRQQITSALSNMEVIDDVDISSFG